VRERRREDAGLLPGLVMLRKGEDAHCGHQEGEDRGLDIP